MLMYYFFFCFFLLPSTVGIWWHECKFRTWMTGKVQLLKKNII